MKHFLLLIVFISALTIVKADSNSFLTLNGSTSFQQSETKSLNTTLNLEYRSVLYEPLHKKWAFVISGKINPDYDHFGNEIKVNVFTVFGFDF